MKDKRKNVWNVLKELKTDRYILYIYSEVGGLVGNIDNREAENEMALDLRDMKVRDNDYYLNEMRNVAVINIHEQDNMPFIKLLYSIIAKWKYISWQEHRL